MGWSCGGFRYALHSSWMRYAFFHWSPSLLDILTQPLDMQWFSTSEMCDILHRFDRIHVVGDSMMRHIAQAFMVLLREDLAEGSRTTWRRDNPSGLDCRCRVNFDYHTCAQWTVVDSELLALMDPASIKCGKHQKPAPILCMSKSVTPSKGS